MSSILLAEAPTSQAEIIDLRAVRPEQLDALLREEREAWNEKLYWDAAAALEGVRRAVERKSLAGKAARRGESIVAYGYYLVEGHRALVGTIAVSRQAPGDAVRAGASLAESLLRAMKEEPGICRIESQFVSFGIGWLKAPFRDGGFRMRERCFLRRSVGGAPLVSPAHSRFAMEPWSPDRIPEAALLMQRAHAGRVDAEMNELYRTREGCRLLLENIAFQRGCGVPLPFASYVALEPKKGALCGVVLATEISAGHAHLAQVAVDPAAQGQGLGSFLLRQALGSLASQSFSTASLMVSQSNQRAVSLYRSLRFRPVVRFPVFSWDRPG